MVRIAVIGATGYTARELLKILARHPHAAVTRVTSRSHLGEPLDSVHPALKNLFDLKFSEPDPATLAADADFVFCCLPHAASAEIICQLDESVKVVDFSADYRLDDLATYESNYQTKHPQPELLETGSVPYGLPELFRDRIEQARLVANPGCFPTSVILALAPLYERDLITDQTVIVDAKTGVSGAGRSAKLRFHFPEANEDVAAYGIGTHRHQPEMVQIIERHVSRKPGLIFTPHLVPMNQGILSTIYVPIRPGLSPDLVRQVWSDSYRGEPFIRLPESPPTTQAVLNSNFCDLWCGQAGDHLVLISVIDNLIKGASGAAVQNFNLMNGFDEKLGLL